MKQVLNDAEQIRLIVWETESENICLVEDLDETCQVERAFIEIIKLYPILELENDSFIIKGSTQIFMEKNFRFVQESLSVENVSTIIKIDAVRIFDSSGREVLVKENAFDTIKLSSFNSGIYFLRIKTNNGVVFNKKFLKN